MSQMWGMELAKCILDSSGLWFSARECGTHSYFSQLMLKCLSIMTTSNKHETEIIKTLLTRLERISVDSHWAHRASGVRGALLKALQVYEQGDNTNETEIQSLILSSFEILLKAAKKQ